MKLFESRFSNKKEDISPEERAEELRSRIASLERDREAIEYWRSQDSSARRQDDERLKEIEEKRTAAKKELEELEGAAV
jgi:adenylate kinase